MWYAGSTGQPKNKDHPLLFPLMFQLTRTSTKDGVGNTVSPSFSCSKTSIRERTWGSRVSKCLEADSGYPQCFNLKPSYTAQQQQQQSFVTVLTVALPAFVLSPRQLSWLPKQPLRHYGRHKDFSNPPPQSFQTHLFIILVP